MPDKASKFIFFTVFMKRGLSIFQFDHLIVCFKNKSDIIPSKLRLRSILNLLNIKILFHIYIATRV